MGLFARKRATSASEFMAAVGWGRVGYSQEPIHVFNDEYTARPIGGPFSVAWQGVQKRQAERYMDTSWNRTGYRNSFQTARLDTPRYQQSGSYNQIRGAWGPVPATMAMDVNIGTPQAQPGLLSDLVGAVKRAWGNA